MVSATDFLPACMIEFMNLDTTMLANFGSGRTSRFSARWRRDIDQAPQLACELISDGLISVELFRTFGTVFGAALLAILDALGVEHAAQDVIAHAGKTLDAAAADH